jgi:general secretion pathway protein J
MPIKNTPPCHLHEGGDPFRMDSRLRGNDSGFTLIEIIIALFIFSIVSIILVGALHNVLNNQSATEKKAARLAKLQIALLLMSHDIEQTIHRPITNPTGAPEGFIGGSDTMTFTHAGWNNPLGQLQHTTLQRTRYQLEEHHLVRITWPVLDQTSETPSNKREILDGISELHFEYLDNKGHFQKIWPPLDQQSAILPRAVRVSLTLQKWGKIQQLYVIAGQPLEKPN